MSVESPDLKIGTTFAVFIWSGISPEANDKFTMCFKGMQIRFDTFLSNTMDILDGSRLCLGLSWSITIKLRYPDKPSPLLLTCAYKSNGQLVNMSANQQNDRFQAIFDELLHNLKGAQA